MLTKKFLLFIFLFLIIGLGIGAGSIFLLPRLNFPIPRESKIYQLLGIKKPMIIGFLPYWLVSKASDDYSQRITTLTYFGLAIDTDGHIIQKTSPQETDPGWAKLSDPLLQQKLQTAKKQNLQTSLLIYQMDEASISALLTDPVTHADTMIADVTPLMRQNGFTDLNVDIESFTDASPSARQAFTAFFQEVKKDVTQNQLGTLTFDLSPKAVIKPYIFDPIMIGQTADYVVIMAYDYNHRGSQVSGPVAPVNGTPDIRDFDVASGLRETLKVIPPEKAILGIPLYGYQWETLSQQPISPVIPRSSSTASQHRANDLLSTCVHCTKILDDISLEPYIIFPGTSDGYFEQIFYEDQESLTKKLELVNQNHIGGIAFWALGYENPDMLRPVEEYKKQFEWVQ